VTITRQFKQILLTLCSCKKAGECNKAWLVVGA